MDKDEIVDLVHRYSYCVDHQLGEAVVDLFTEDCVVDYGPAIAPVLRGRQALRAMFGVAAEPTAAPPDAVATVLATSHHNANVLITFEGDDRASVLTSLYAWHRAAEGADPRLWGYYHDVAVRTPEGWRLSSRQLRIAGNENWDAGWLPLVDDSEGDV
jgi:hypothetical protein